MRARLEIIEIKTIWPLAFHEVPPIVLLAPYRI